MLEIGAGDGALAAVLRGAGYDVTAIDPRGEGDVLPVALLDLAAEPFDAAVAMTSLHHVEPLTESVEHLAALLRPGARLVVDEYDVDALDERAAAWWLNIAGEDQDPAEHVAHMRHHILLGRAHPHRARAVVRRLRTRARRLPVPPQDRLGAPRRGRGEDRRGRDPGDRVPLHRDPPLTRLARRRAPSPAGV